MRTKLVTYVHKPAVSVLVREVNSKRVIVYGQVQRPGTFPYTDAMTISRAISLAGGFTAMAARDRVMVSHTEQEKQKVTEIDLRAIATGKAPNQYVYPGDEVFSCRSGCSNRSCASSSSISTTTPTGAHGAVSPTDLGERAGARRPPGHRGGPTRP